MRLRPKILQPARRIRHTAGTRAFDQHKRSLIVPILTGDRTRETADQDNKPQNAHRRGISRWVRRAATTLAVVTLAACSDAFGPGGGTATADLLPLGLAAEADFPAGATFWVSNSRLTVRALRHSDGFNTLYAEVRFTPGILASLDGVPLSSGDSAQVTVTPRAGGYGLTLGPSGLAFAIDGTPTITFAYARYADVSVADGSSYASGSEYAASLDVWEEFSPGRWRIARNSALAAGDQITAALDAPGRVMVAAPR